MNDSKQSSRIAALRALESSFQKTGCAPKSKKSSRLRKAWARVRPRHRTRLRTRIRASLGHRAVRLGLQISVVVLALIAVSAGGLWMRLAAGPISIDLITPLLSSAIEHTLGSRHRVEIGGSQIERDQGGRMSLRIRDILIRDADGAVVAGAPKAEVAVSTTGLLMGSLHAKRVSLVGAELAVRIETDGQVTISTGAERRPIAVTPAIAKPAAATPAQQNAVVPSSSAQPGADQFATLMRWLDRFAKGETENEILGELGLKGGNLIVDDRRNGKTWTFEQINFSMNRYGRGGLIFNLGSDNEERPWQLSAAMIPNGYERRSVQIEARQVSTRDILLAMRLDEGDFQFDIPVTGSIRAEIGADFMPQVVEGRLMAEGGRIGNAKNEDESVNIDKAEMNLDWDSTRRSLVAPFKIASGRNRVTLLSQFEAPMEPGLPWRLIVTGGSIVLGPPQADEAPLVLNRILVRALLDPATKRIDLLQGDVGGGGVNLAMSGNIDFSSGEPLLSGGMVGMPMKGNLAKRIWPVFVATKVRTWVLENIQGGDVSRIEIAANAPMLTLKEDGPPIPDDGLSVEVDINNATLRPLEGLPAIREADLTTRIKGRNVVVNVGRGIVELESGRRLTVSNGVFEVPDTHPKSPPARARLKVEGPVSAAAELVALDRLKEASGAPFDPATSRGNVVGQISVGLPIASDPPTSAVTYSIALDVSNFGAEKLMGQKVEAQTLKVSATQQGFQIKGDVRINGTVAALDYRKPRNEAESEIRLQLVLDDAARSRFGFDAGPALTGPVGVRLAGRMTGDKDARISVDADLTQARIDNLMPGWVKPSGKPNRATFSVVSKDKTTRFEDVVIDGSGALVKGNAELDSSGDLIAANFPVFALSDGDKTSLKADRSTDGTLRLSMRGEVYDGRNFVKSVFGGQSSDPKVKQKFQDMDVDVRLGAIAGHNGEALRGVELKMTRRAGQIRTFMFNSKIGRDTALSGDLRGAARGRQVLYFETDDAGALFRFTDNYARMHGGQMWVAIDPPTPDQQPQDGLLNIRDFSIKGEPSLERVVSGAGAKGVDFSRMRVEFTRTPGRLTIREGLVRGPTIGATIDGNIDFAKSDVRMRGTFVPLYGLNNAFGQIPIVGLFLGGSNEGLLGITYEVVGAPNAPVLRVNPISAVAPGLLRKFFEFPTATPPAEQRPSAYTSPAQ
jgi:Protein of unknown function